MRLRSTAEQEEIDGEQSECVDEIVPLQETVDLQTSFREESMDSTSKMLGSIMMPVSLSFALEDYDISRA